MKPPAILLGLVLLCSTCQADSDIVLQSTPSDCGPATLATLLEKYLNVPTTEREMVLLSGSNPQYGTTLMDMEQAVKVKGCQSNSYRMDWKTLKDQTESFPVPVIVRMLNPQPHFCVLLGIDGDMVYLADPSAGHILMDRKDFQQRWLLPVVKTGYVFLALGPEGTVNQERRVRVLKRLARQKQTLQTWPVFTSPFRRS